MVKPALRIATICSGIGAPEKALRQLGINYNTEYFAEFDKHAAKSYCAIHSENETKNLGDLTKVDIEKLPKGLDLIVGGTPCQDFSLAGKRAGGEVDSNTRSSLMWNFVEIIKETLPKVILWENVPGCLTAEMYPNYKKFISTLISLGYEIHSKVLNAKEFAIPQNRDRIFVLGTRKGLNIKFALPAGYDCGIRLKDILENEVAEKYYLSEQFIKGLFTHKKRHDGKGTGFGWKPTDPEKHAACLRANSALAPTDNTLIELTEDAMHSMDRIYDSTGLARTLKGEAGGGAAKTGLYTVPHGFNKGGFKEVEHCPSITTSAFEQNNFIAFNPYHNSEIKDFAPTQTTCCGSNTNSSSVIIAKPEEIPNSANITTLHETKTIEQILESPEHADTLTINGKAYVFINGRFVSIRKLTPRECFRLMGFTDTDFNACKMAGISDSQLYKQAGNSIVVNVLMAIFGELYGIDWKPIVYGKWFKTEQERYCDLPIFQTQGGN